MPDRPVVVEQARRIVTERLAPAQTREHVINHRLVGVELSDIPADIFFPCVPQQIQFRLVHPQDRAVSANPVKSDGRGLDEITQDGLATA